MTMRRAALFFVALLAVPVALQAQKCIGQAPWSSGSLKIGGSLEFGGGSTEIAGGLSTGKDQGLFLAAGAGVVTDNSQVFLSGGLGKELSKPLADKITICPVANATYFLKKDGFSEFDVFGGLSGGYPVAMSSKNVGLILTGSAQLGFEHVSVDAGICGTAGVDCTSTDFVGLFGFGAGFIFNNRISLVPQLVLPTRGSVALLIIANVAVGKKK
jgi:hypothetical protein